MREKRLSKDRTNFGMEMSSQSPHHFSRVNAPVNALTMPTADETWPEGGLRRGRSATHTMSTVEHLYAPISERPKPNRAIEPSDRKENAIAPHRCAVYSSFFWAMQLVPLQRREAMHAVYAFCREVDDIADSDASRSLKQILLANWRSEIGLLFAGQPQHDVTHRLRG